MAQLVKLSNYISRYERGIYHYPAQFIRLKKENWQKTNHSWEKEIQEPPALEIEEEQLPRWKSLFKNKKKEEDTQESINEIIQVPLSDKERKQSFLDSLFPFQLKWASTTIGQMSFLDSDFRKDSILKYFLQRFPDTYMLFYKPVFTLKGTPMETDILLVGPFGIDIIKIIEKSADIYYIATDDRTWREEKENDSTGIVSPMLSLNRTEKVVKGILGLYGNDFPIRKVVLSRKSQIHYNQEPYNTRYVGSEKHSEWLEEKRKNAHLLKHRQLRVCELLLSHCESAAFRRPEWNETVDYTNGNF